MGWPNTVCNMKYIAVVLYRMWRGQKTRPSPTQNSGWHAPSTGICAYDQPHFSANKTVAELIGLLVLLRLKLKTVRSIDSLHYPSYYAPAPLENGTGTFCIRVCPSVCTVPIQFEETSPLSVELVGKNAQNSVRSSFSPIFRERWP